MTTGALGRCWLLGLVSLSATVAGCATPAGISPAGSLWSSWGKTSAKRKFSPDEKKLKDPVKLNTMYARFREEQGDYAEARRRYELVLGEQPKSIAAILGLARLDQLAGRALEAEQGYKQALKLHSDDPHVLDAVGQFYVSQRRWEEAVDMLDAAMRAAPEEPSYRYHLAVALAQSGDTAAAMPHFAKTVGDAQAHFNVGYILYKQGQAEAAEQQFVQAVLKKPDLKQAQRMLDTVRRKREYRLMLAGDSAGGAAPENSAHGDPFQPAYSAGRPTPPGQAMQPGIVNSMHSQQASRPNYQHAPPQGRLPGLQPPGRQPVQPGRSLGTSAGLPPQPPTTEPAGNRPAIPAGMTAPQLEQWKNQFGNGIGN